MAKYGDGLAAHEGDQAKALMQEIGPWRVSRAGRLARHGRLHPDPEVARLTVRWSNAVLSAEPRYPAEASSATRFFRSLLVEFFTLGLWGDFHFQRALSERRSIKFARLIIRAAESADSSPNSGELRALRS